MIKGNPCKVLDVPNPVRSGLGAPIPGAAFCRSTAWPRVEAAASGGSRLAPARSWIAYFAPPPFFAVQVSTSKTGKHGHAKCHFVAQDVFTGKKMEDLVPASHTTSIPFIKKIELQVVSIDDEFVSLLTDTGEMREDIKLPKYLSQAPPDADQVSNTRSRRARSARAATS
mgnify:CR=1 FL=1